MALKELSSTGTRKVPITSNAQHDSRGEKRSDVHVTELSDPFPPRIS